MKELITSQSDKRYRSDIYASKNDYTSQDILEMYKDNDKYGEIFGYTEKQLNKHSFESYTPSNNITFSNFLKLYFSNKNIKNLQNQIRYNVYLKSNKRFIIEEQNIDTLGVIMESMYLQYSTNPTQECEFKKEIQRLNNLVSNYSVDTIISAIEMQNAYIKKVTSDIIPMKPGEYTNKKGSYITKTYKPF
jgi:hypothetical protein